MRCMYSYISGFFSSIVRPQPGIAKKHSTASPQFSSGLVLAYASLALSGGHHLDSSGTWPRSGSSRQLTLRQPRLEPIRFSWLIACPISCAKVPLLASPSVGV